MRLHPEAFMLLGVVAVLVWVVRRGQTTGVSRGNLTFYRSTQPVGFYLQQAFYSSLAVAGLIASLAWGFGLIGNSK